MDTWFASVPQQKCDLLRMFLFLFILAVHHSFNGVHANRVLLETIWKMRGFLNLQVCSCALQIINTSPLVAIVEF